MVRIKDDIYIILKKQLEMRGKINNNKNILNINAFPKESANIPRKKRERGSFHREVARYQEFKIWQPCARARSSLRKAPPTMI